MAKYKAKLKACQLIVKVRLSFKEKVDDSQIEFFSGKYIRGLLRVKTVKKHTLEYYGPVGVSLQDRLKKPISKYDFLFIMEQVVDIVQKLNSNALILNNVVFDMQGVFINETTKELQFIYLPLLNNQSVVDVFGFIEQIVYAAKPIQENDMNYVSRFIHYIRNLNNFDLDRIEKYILKEDRNVVNTIKRHNVGQSGFMTDKPADYYAHYGKDEEATGLLDEEKTGLLNEEATGLLEDEATGLLNENLSNVHYPTLYRSLTGETILINKPVFRIGKEKSYSDYFVSNNDKVSRSHADIITRGERYYVIDLNSKNKTFVNGVVVLAQQEMEIFDGDCIKLANEEFEFRK